MKNIFGLITAIAFLLVIATGCKKDKDTAVAQPTLSNVEIGSDNSLVGYRGHDLHTEAGILAPGKIASVQVIIHSAAQDGNWEYNHVYDAYKGLLNATFHEHIDIPADADLGTYRLQIEVTDELGQVTTFEEEHLEIKEDNTLASVSDYTLQVTDGGDSLQVKAAIHAPNKIASVGIEVHAGNQETEIPVTDPNMAGQVDFNLNTKVDISDIPDGTQGHVHLAVKDQEGKEVEFEEPFSK